MEQDPATSDASMAPIVQAWLGAVEECRKAKSSFNSVASLCRKFYAGLSGFMWKNDFKEKYFKTGSGSPSIASPKFAVTINKAFELVAIFGPYLYWKYPHRGVRSYEKLKVFPELLGDPQDQFVQEQFGALQQQIESEERVADMRNSALERYLNYAQREQPGGGLETHSLLAITEALICGRGCLWTENYQFPGSEANLTGSFYDTVDNLLVDPDCTDPTLTDANYIIRIHVNTSWEVEKRFGLPRGSMMGKGKWMSGSGQAIKNTTQSNANETERREGYDLIEWFEIWSKAGVTGKLGSRKLAMEDDFDEVVGDYAYLCIASNVDYPLNCPEKVFDKASNDKIRECFDWPVPYWRDNRWPVTCLDFYRDTQGCWPVAPLAPGLGELICINVLTSCVISHSYENSRTIIGVLGEALDKVKSALESDKSPAVVELPPSIGKSVTDCIQYLQRPEVNEDVWKAIDYLSGLFDKRTGLSELLYSMNPGGAQSRSAADAKIKAENASVRPDYMASQVAKWQARVAEVEKLCAYWHVKPEDVVPLLGNAGALVWERFVHEEDPEVIFREVRCYVEASDIQKPNQARDMENIQTVGQYLIAELSKHADATGDTGPLNAFIQMTGEAMNQSFDDVLMGPRVPMPPPPEAMQMQQQQMELEAAKLQADVEKSQADAQATAMEAQNAQEMLAAEMQQKQMELEFEAAKGEQELQLERDKAMLQMQIEQAKAQSQMELQQQQAGQQMALSGMQMVDKITQARMSHAQSMQQQREKVSVAAKTKKKAKAKT